MQESHTGRAGQALQMAHWPGSHDHFLSEAKPGIVGAEKNLEKRWAGMNSIYCDL